jgi:hypothetical protein
VASGVRKLVLREVSPAFVEGVKACDGRELAAAPARKGAEFVGLYLQALPVMGWR